MTNASDTPCSSATSAVRAGIDRDLDGALDGDEVLHGSGPAGPQSTPDSCGGG